MLFALFYFSQFYFFYGKNPFGYKLNQASFSASKSVLVWQTSKEKINIVRAGLHSNCLIYKLFIKIKKAILLLNKINSVKRKILKYNLHL